MHSFVFSAIMIVYMFLSSANASERIYIDEKEIDNVQDCFHIHTGKNIWIETNTVHRDRTGLYTFEYDLIRHSNKSTEYKKRWKCPYCNQYWPVGSPCKDPECPSKYK